MRTDFLLDSKIRLWVFLPIVLLTFFVEILRHYAILLFNDKITLLLNEIQDLEMKKRVVVLLKHHSFIPKLIPFPLTLSFKSMLQRNIELAYLDPSWVSSCSWYFLNVFGLRNSLNMFFEDHLESEFSDYESFVGGVQVCFKEDFNALEMTVHKSALYVL
ncbi:hypothetical protein YQE_01529, partial [Dendroctonus ponderosae]